MATSTASHAARFTFLSKPPAAKKLPANSPLPSPPLPRSSERVLRRRSSTFSAGIKAWAQAVQPGSPSSPKDISSVPHSPTSPCRGSISLSVRRPSITGGQSRTGSFLNISTPTSGASSPLVFKQSFGLNAPLSAKSFDAEKQPVDLTDFGYASVFLNLPYTPTTPSPFVAPRNFATPAAAMPIPPIPETPKLKAPKAIKRFRSLSILKPKSSNKPAAPSANNKPSKSDMFFKSKKSSAPAPQKPFAKYEEHPTVHMLAAQRELFAGGGMKKNLDAVRQELLQANHYIDNEGRVWESYEDMLDHKPLTQAQSPTPSSPGSSVSHGHGQGRSFSRRMSEASSTSFGRVVEVPLRDDGILNGYSHGVRKPMPTIQARPTGSHIDYASRKKGRKGAVPAPIMVVQFQDSFNPPPCLSPPVHNQH